jgi:RES domain-containing protein
MEDLLAHWGRIIGQQKPRKISGAFWYRAVYKTRRDSIMTMDGAYLYGGRYNTEMVFGALYLSESPEACAAEMRRRPRTPPDYFVGKINVTVQKICDLTDPILLEKLNLEIEDLCEDDWECTRMLGDLIRDAGFEGVLVPSAAGDYKNLVLFLDRFTSESSVELVDVQPLLIDND